MLRGLGRFREACWCMDLGSGGTQVRPPKGVSAAEPLRRWDRPPKLAPESLDFRLWRGDSVAEPAAEHA